MKKMVLMMLCILFLLVSCAKTDSSNSGIAGENDADFVSGQDTDSNSNVQDNDLTPDVSNGDADLNDLNDEDEASNYSETDTFVVEDNSDIPDETTQNDNNQTPDIDQPSGIVEKTWTDPNTGLTWDTTDYGYVIQNGAETSVRVNNKSFKNAKKFCEDLTVAGKTEWRLPIITELRTLVFGCDKIALNGSCQVTHENPYKHTNEECYGVCNSDSATPTCSGETEVCKRGEGDGPEGCYWNSEFPLSCGKHWSSTQASGSNFYWTLDFFGADIITVSTSFPDGMAALVRCVHD